MWSSLNEKAFYKPYWAYFQVCGNLCSVLNRAYTCQHLSFLYMIASICLNQQKSLSDNTDPYFLLPKLNPTVFFFQTRPITIILSSGPHRLQATWVICLFYNKLIKTKTNLTCLHYWQRKCISDNFGLHTLNASLSYSLVFCQHMKKLAKPWLRKPHIQLAKVYFLWSSFPRRIRWTKNIWGRDRMQRKQLN